MTDRIVLLDGDRVLAVQPLTPARLLLGSAATCALRDPRLQPEHAAVEPAGGGGWRLIALGGAPLAVDGHARPAVELRPGRIALLGSLRVRLATAAEGEIAVPPSGPAATTAPEPPPAARPAPGARPEPVRPAAAPTTNPAAMTPLAQARARIADELAKTVIGQQEVVEQVLVAMFAGGHCLLIGAPGLAKTLLVRALAAALHLDHRRVQFTPDLMPSDIVGTEVLEEAAGGRRSFRFQKGPVFTNLLLADEINRTPPKTQAALLEAMQERRVTAGGATMELPKPFLVLATQNPIEQEGTYPLPEAQLDRFMFAVTVPYPGAEEETRILLATTGEEQGLPSPVLSAEEILAHQATVRRMPVSPHVAGYAARLVRATRPNTPEAPEWISRQVRWGAGPRAGQYLLLAAKARALLAGRANVSCADVKAFAAPVLRHRVFVSFAAAAEGLGADEVVKRLIEEIEEPKY